LDVRAGKFSYDELRQRADELTQELESRRLKSTLPPAPDQKTINQLLLEITEDWETHHAN